MIWSKILDNLSSESLRVIEQLCIDEGEARLDAYERGEIEALSGQEAIRWLNEQASN